MYRRLIVVALAAGIFSTACTKSDTTQVAVSEPLPVSCLPGVDPSVHACNAKTMAGQRSSGARVRTL